MSDYVLLKAKDGARMILDKKNILMIAEVVEGSDWQKQDCDVGDSVIIYTDHEDSRAILVLDESILNIATKMGILND